MHLKTFQVTNFRSVEDSGTVEVGRLACLVGKNEAGKTALLQALAGLNPHSSTPFAYDAERDYPRRHLNAYQRQVRKEEAVVVTTTWSLEEEELAKIAGPLGPEWSDGGPITALRRYGAKGPEWGLPLNFPGILAHLYAKFGLSDEEKTALAAVTTTSELTTALQAIQEPNAGQATLLALLAGWPDHCATGLVKGFLRKHFPTFMYFSHYDRMAGQIRLDDVKSDDHGLYHEIRVPGSPGTRREDLDASERVFVEFLDFTGTSLEEIAESETYESLNAKCESASNAITDQLQEYWTQNPFLEVEVRVTKAETGDKPPFDEGTIARARVRNTLHRVTVPFSERSAGFVWFFSFLVKFSQIKDTDGEVVLLLDEPGLTLHGKAQADLLRYFNDRILPDHQLVFSTHSPFMVPTEDLTLSRIVEDQVMEERPRRYVSSGTKVRDDVLATDPDTLFPLQGALGYDLTQSLFVGKHTLLVEGPGDILFLKVLSAQLKRRKRTGLDPRWTLCPAGGIDKIQSFVSLFAGSKLNLAVLTDFAAGDRRKIEHLRQSKTIAADRVMNFAELLGLPEADVEDVFAVELYLKAVNEGFGLTAGQKLTQAKLDKAAAPPGRLLKRTEAAFRPLPPDAPEFDHFTPADWLIRNPAALDGKDEAVETTLDNAERIFGAVNQHIGQ